MLSVLAFLSALCAGIAFAGASPTPRHAPALGVILLSAPGPGYSVSAQGPLGASRLAPSSPGTSDAATALATSGGSIGTFQRSWQDAVGTNQVQDLLVRFSTASGAATFLRLVRHALDSGEIVSSGPLRSIPGSERTTYFASGNQVGVGQAITVRTGVYVDLPSFFSGAAGNSQPITPADAERVARAQYAALVSAVGGTPVHTPSGKSVSWSDVAWAVLALAVVAAAVATPLVLRRPRDAYMTRRADAPVV